MSRSAIHARRVRRACRAAALLAVLGLAAGGAACAGTGSERQPTDAPAHEPARTESETAAPKQTHESAWEVDLTVLSGSGGVFPFADVFIEGRGPFSFIVDTGASHSVIDWDVVRTLGIKTIGKPVTVTGITCRGRAGTLRMRNWRVGKVALPRAVIQTIDMPEPGEGVAIDGLLGSDILSKFGSITVDYAADRLLLRRRS